MSVSGLTSAVHGQARSLRPSVRLTSLQQIPKVAVKVFEHRDGSIGLFLWAAHKNDTFGPVRFVIAVEVIGVKEQEDASAGLVTDARALVLGGRPCQQQPRLAAPAGEMTTQRFDCSGMNKSSTSTKPSLPTKKDRASS